MEMIRKIIEVSESKIQLEMPESLQGKTVEVIIIPVSDQAQRSDIMQTLFENPIHLKDFSLWNRDSIYEERLR
jgi:hypothetical protein